MKRSLNEIETFRAQELLMQRATEGLDPSEAAELEALGVADDVSFDLAATGVDLATLQIEQMPADVAGKILIAAGVDASRTTLMPSMIPMTLAGVVPPRSISTVPPGAAPAYVPVAFQPGASTLHAPSENLAPERPPPRDAPVIPLAPRASKRGTSYTVVAAAASIVLAAGAVLWATQQAPREIVKEKIVEVPIQPPVKAEPTATEARAELLASAPDVTTLTWAATKDPNAAGASGDVVWSESAQRGYMRFVGLTPNNKDQLQYQLWIFDKSRDQAFPVDGGVFDVSSTGEVIIPITARLQVTEPVLFAVTIEQPGGVVVSKRERIVVTAAPKTG